MLSKDFTEEKQLSSDQDMFTISHHSLGTQSEVRLMNIQSGEMVSVLPETGACLNLLLLSKNNQIYSLLDGAETENDLSRTKDKFCGSFLFPFPNRVKDGKYYNEGVFHQLPVNFAHENNAIHGLLLNKKFTITQEVCTNTEAILGLEYKSSGEEGFPYPFRISIEFVLSSSKGFGCKTIIRNESQFIMPAAVGWHPYFKLGAVDDCQISFPAKTELTVDRQMIPTGARNPEFYFEDFQPLRDKNFDTCFGLNKENMHLIRLFNPSLSVVMNLWQEGGNKGFNYLQVYTPPDRGSIALEPMTAAPDAFNNSLGLYLMEAGDSCECSFGVYLE